MPDPQNATGTTTPTDAPPLNLAGLRVRTVQQAKAELPQPKITPPWEEESELPSSDRLSKAYDAAKSWLGEHEQHLSEKYLAPFREGLDRIGSDLQQAGESGHTPAGGQLTGPTRALASGVGSLLKQVPIGRNVRETALAMATPPELGPEGESLSRELKAGEKAAPNLEGLRTREVPPATRPAPNLEGIRYKEVSSAAKELPAQPRLPDTGTHAAIKTDDGSIYFDDAPEKQRTHIMFAKDLDIPPERVVSGGWLKDGEYEGSARSDAGKWGEQARAQAAVAEKRTARAGEAPTSDQLISKAKEVFGTTTDHNEAGFILPNGEMLDFSGKKAKSSVATEITDPKARTDWYGGKRVLDHRDIFQAFPEDYKKPADANYMKLFERQANAVRLSTADGDVNVSFNEGVKPTPEQLSAIRKAVQSEQGALNIDFYNKDGRVAKSLEKEFARPGDLDSFVNEVFPETKAKPDMESAWKKFQAQDPDSGELGSWSVGNAEIRKVSAIPDFAELRNLPESQKAHAWTVPTAKGPIVYVRGDLTQKGFQKALQHELEHVSKGDYPSFSEEYPQFAKPSSQSEQPSWEKSGKDFESVYHGGKTKVAEVDPGKLQQRDAGFFGKGFYVTANEKFAGTYGSKVSKKTFNSDARILDVDTIHPGYEKKVNPDLQKEIEATQRSYYQGLPKAQKDPGLVDRYMEMVDPKNKAFDLGTWVEAVNRYADKNGYDAIRFSDGEIVVKNPKALAPETPRRKSLADDIFDQATARLSGKQGGHAGGRVASEEELARPGRFVKISKSGMPTDQGKIPDFNLKAGEAGYQVLPNGTWQLKAGQESPTTKAGVQNYAREVFKKR